ncbi:Transmembrane and TPR repeat-containing protein 4 [Nymphon striatum]|nr:Transmembrane and TPR repeat-containing protein 4 [Nymphon striatum]
MEAVLQIKRTVEEKMQNPFHPSLATDKLMNISTGQILAATTLVDAKRLGLKAMDAATTTNADKIVQPKMETFATHLKKIQKKIDTVKEVIREESAVTRALCFAQNLSDEARTEAFSYEWLEQKLPDSWEPLKELPPSAADAVYVVDAMAFVQRFNTLGSSTFGQLQERYREKLLNMKPRHCTDVHFVGDQYDFGLKSLKGDERQRRESNINLPEYVPADIIKIPDWKTLLSNPCNKTNMLSYLASRWSQEASWPAGFCLVLGVNAQATRVTQTEHTDVDELYCPNHEEADTRIFAHIASCDDNNVFVIQATDTDIIVLAMYHFLRLPNVVELWMEKNDLFLSIHDLVNESAKAVGKDVLALTDTLLISYILSGCDSVSYPFKRGYLSLDKLRAHLFASRKLDLRSLPPTEDAFHFHVLRSLCQISLYKQVSLSNPVLLPPEEYGRIVDGDRLIPVMKSKPSKPSAAKLKYCKCKKKPNCLRNCPCAKAAVPCIIACACNGDREKCGRLLTDHYDDDDDDDDEILIMSAALMIVPFLPASNVFFRVGFVIAERVLYIPSLGYCLLVILGFHQICQQFTKIQRCSEWNNESLLFHSGLKVCPLNAKVHYNIAKTAADSGDRNTAVLEYSEAIKLNPDYDQALNNLANILKDNGQLIEAEKLLLNAIYIRPDFAAAWMNLGIVQASLRKHNDAEKSYLIALSHRKRYPDCLYNLGNLIERGVRQGCVLSPSLFNICTEMIFREIEDRQGVHMGGRNITNIRFADDTTLLAKDENTLNDTLQKIKNESLKYGLSMNNTKTKTMVISKKKKEEKPKINITIDGNKIEQVRQYTYLGQLLDEDADHEKEIKRRIEISRRAFNNMKGIFVSRKINIKLKLRLVKCYIWSILLYGVETWTISKKMEERLEAYEMWIYRRIGKVSWTERRTNEYVLRMLGIKKQLLNIVKERKLKYYGHIKRHQTVQRITLEGKVEGKRSRGKQRLKWEDNIKGWTKRSMEECGRLAKDRYLEMQRYDDAYRVWKNATILKPTQTAAWNNMVIMLDSIGNLKKAVEVAEEALYILPSEASLHFNFANTLGKLSQYEESELHFIQAIKLKSDNPTYYTNLGVLYHRWKKYDKAEKAYQMALKINQNAKSAQENLELLRKQLSKHRGK